MIGPVRRVGTPWLVSLPFMVAGCLAAHSLAYHLVSTRQERHGYLAFAPLFLGLLAALALVGVLRRGRMLSPLACALLPPVAFVVQEHVERLEFVATEPAFVVGLLLQVPFALAALVAARAFVGVADLVRQALAGRPPAARPRVPFASRPGSDLLRPPLLTGPRSPRAPPAVA
jgi:hypothetical protein